MRVATVASGKIQTAVCANIQTELLVNLFCFVFFHNKMAEKKSRVFNRREFLDVRLGEFSVNFLTSGFFVAFSVDTFLYTLDTISVK